MEPIQKTALIHRILLNRPTRVITSLVIFAVILPIVSYMVWFSRELFSNDMFLMLSGSCSNSDLYHIRCGPQNISKETCISIRCCYSLNHGCIHRFPSAYQFIRTASNKTRLTSTELKSPFGHNAVPLDYCIDEMTENSMRFTFSHASNTKWSCGNIKRDNTSYRYDIDEEKCILDVYDKTNNDRLLISSSRGPLIADEMYFEWSIYFGANMTMFGFGDYVGEHQLPYTKLLWYDTESDYVPFFWLIDNETKKIVLVRLSSNGPVEVEVSSSNILSIRSLNSEWFSIELYMESSCDYLLNQINDDFDYNIPFWMLGVHIVVSINETDENILKNLTQVKMPYDSLCFFNDHFWLFNNSSSIDLTEALNISRLYENRIQISVLPQVIVASESYREAYIEGLLLTDAGSIMPYHGVVNNQTVAYLDWTARFDILSKWLDKYFEDLSRFDGISMQTHLLKDDTLKETENASLLQYFSDSFLDKLGALVPTTIHSSSKNMGTGLFALNSVIHTAYLEILSKYVRAPISSTSYTGKNSVHVWRNRYASTWSDLQNVFRQMLADYFAGIPLSGSNVCGFHANNNETAELCIRWYQLASVGSHFQIALNATPDKFDAFTMNCMLSTVRRRYAILPYLYSTLMSRTALIRPFFIDYPHYSFNINALRLGPSMFVFPVLQPSISELTINLPVDSFELWGGKFLPKGEHTLYVGIKHLPMFLLSGRIVPMHPLMTSTNNASSTEKHSITLYIGLDCITETENTPELCWANGQHIVSPLISYIYKADQFKMTLLVNTTMNHLDEFCIVAGDGMHQIDRIRLYKNRSPMRIIDIHFDICLQENKENEFDFYFD